MFEQAFKNIDAKTIDKGAFTMDQRGAKEINHRSPLEIIDEITLPDVRSAKVLKTIGVLV